jgi:hypothetical protein
MPLIIAWRSKLEAARLCVKEGETDAAVRLLIEAVKSVESSGNPHVILDALLNTGREMRPLDPGRAARLLQLAADLAKAIHNKAALQHAASLLNSLPGRHCAPTPTMERAGKP